MKEIRTTFYEVRSYFIPGCILLWAILELLCIAKYEPSTLAISSFNPAVKGGIFIVIAYVLGHGLHAIANFTIDKLPFGSYPPKNYFSEQFQKDFTPEVAQSLRESIVEITNTGNVDDMDEAEVLKKGYWVCFQYVMNENNAETENFLGLTGFYRGITSATSVISVLYFSCYIWFKVTDMVIVGIISLIFSVFFLARVIRFNNYLAKNVYSNFLYLYKRSAEKVTG